jgi:signal transduction histidine kinase/HAMP domain-containing protein
MEGRTEADAVRSPGSIGGRLRTGFALLTVLIAAAGAFVYAGFARQEGAIRQLNERFYVLQRVTADVNAYFADSQLAIANYQLTFESRFLDGYDNDGASFDAGLNLMRAEAPASMQVLVDQQDREGKSWFALAGQIIGSPATSVADTTRTDRAWAASESFKAANTAMARRINDTIRHLIASSNTTLGVGLAWSGAALAVAIALGLAVAVSTVRRTAGPLRGLTMTLNRLAAGDHAARADASGAAEIQQVASAVNALADESDQLRRAEAESNRLRAMTREAGVRIREHLQADSVIRAASAAVEEILRADAVYLHVLQDGRMSRPVGHEGDWLLPDTFLESLPEAEFARVNELLRNHASQVIQDVPGSEGEQLLPEVREPLRQAGVRSHLLTPFGVGSELLGIIVAERLRGGQPWTDAEVDAVESTAADLGRGLYHARLYEEENRLVEELTSVDRAKSDFVATVSHELRTPLTSITGYIEMLMEGDPGQLNPEQERMLGAVNRNANRLQALIEDLLTLSGMESGTFTTEPQPANLTDIISGAGEDIQPAALSKGVTVTTQCPDDGLIVNGDASQLARVMANLLSNAVKFTPAGGQVRLTAQRAGDWAVVRVADTGIGIPDGDKENLFTRFFRATNAAKRAVQGSGLGLAITRTIVTSHGGDLDLESQEDKGTTVTMRLPLIEDAGPGGSGGPDSGDRHGSAARGTRS